VRSGANCTSLLGIRVTNFLFVTFVSTESVPSVLEEVADGAAPIHVRTSKCLRSLTSVIDGTDSYDVAVEDKYIG